MTASRPMCIGIPVDHRFGQLPISKLRPDAPRWLGNHAQIIEGYGQTHKRNPSINEINFAKWLSLPETKGGVLIVLQQPAKYQRYFDDHAATVEKCASLKAVNDVCRTMVGYDLAQVSCFDAFPYQTSLWHEEALSARDAQFDEAYNTFLMMVNAKEPDVILCCYQSPHDTKYKHFQSRGVKISDNFLVALGGREYLCINGFHPSYAINHNKTSSVLRSLLIAKISQAFFLVNGSNLLDTLIVDLSDRYSQELQAFKGTIQVFASHFSTYMSYRREDSTWPYQTRERNQGRARPSNLGEQHQQASFDFHQFRKRRIHPSERRRDVPLSFQEPNQRYSPRLRITVGMCKPQLPGKTD